MPWRQIDQRFVRQDYPALNAQWFCDDTSRGSGELIMWLDGDQRVVAFQLSREEWPSLRHYVAEWHEGRGVRIGQVDEGEASSRGVGHKAAPVIHYEPGPDPHWASKLLTYFRANAEALPPAPRHTIQAVLSEATDVPDRPAA